MQILERGLNKVVIETKRIPIQSFVWESPLTIKDLVFLWMNFARSSNLKFLSAFLLVSFRDHLCALNGDWFLYHVVFGWLVDCRCLFPCIVLILLLGFWLGQGLAFLLFLCYLTAPQPVLGTKVLSGSFIELIQMIIGVSYQSQYLIADVYLRGKLVAVQSPRKTNR